MYVPRLRAVDRSHECRVCGHHTDGAHFGVECCRACAAFFRRSVSLNLAYKCRGNTDCSVDTNIRCICRCCRLAKCFRVGMKRELVRERENTRKDVGRDSDPGPSGISEQVVDRLPPCFSFDKQLAPLLSRIRKGYRALYHARTQYKLSYPQNHPERSTVCEVIELIIRDFPNVFRFVNSCFPLDGVSETQKKQMCREFYVQLYFLENAYRSVRICEQNGWNDLPRYYFPDGSYHAFGDNFFAGSKRSLLQEEEVRRLNDAKWSQFRSLLMLPMQRLRLDELELCALFLFAFFIKGDEKYETTTERLDVVMKNKVVSELLAVYSRTRSMDLVASSTRLAAILDLIISAQKPSELFHRDVFVNALLVADDRFDLLQTMFNSAT